MGELPPGGKGDPSDARTRTGAEAGEGAGGAVARPRRTGPATALTGAARASALRARHGSRAEKLAAAYLERHGWRVLARRVRVGRDEIDLVAVDPGPPGTLVIVEVRSRSTSRFGSPEESVDRRKVARLYRAALALRRGGVLPDGSALPALPWRADLVAVDDAPAIGPGAGGPVFRHVRALEPD